MHLTRELSIWANYRQLSIEPRLLSGRTFVSTLHLLISQSHLSTEKYGILEDPDRLIRLYQSGVPYFRSKHCLFYPGYNVIKWVFETILTDIVPRHSKHICITIDAQKAAELGVMFFHTLDVNLVAVGKNGAIPVEAVRSVVELKVTKQDLI